MTLQEQHRLDQLLQIIRWNAERIIDDKRYSDRDMLLVLHQQVFKLLSGQRDQALVDMGSVGLAYAVRAYLPAGQEA